MGEERYFIYYKHGSSHHWANVEDEPAVLRFAALQRRRNEEDGFECRKIEQVLKVEVTGRYKVRPSFGLYPIKGNTEPPIPRDAPCTDPRCPVDGPHTANQCHKIPRCHNPCCGDVEQGTHWTKDCKWPNRIGKPERR